MLIWTFGRFAALCLVPVALAQTPEWIWSGSEPPKASETRFFRKTFSIPFPPKDAGMVASGDDEITIYLNGQEVGRSDDWRKPVRADVVQFLAEGQNAVAIKNRQAGSQQII